MDPNLFEALGVRAAKCGALGSKLDFEGKMTVAAVTGSPMRAGKHFASGFNEGCLHVSNWMVTRLCVLSVANVR